MDALACRNPGLDICRAIGAWNHYVWNRWIKSNSPGAHHKFARGSSRSRCSRYTSTGRLHKQLAYRLWWRSSAQTPRLSAGSWLENLRRWTLMNHCSERSQQAPVWASWELEWTGLAGHWPLASLQCVEVGAWAEFCFFLLDHKFIVICPLMNQAEMIKSLTNRSLLIAGHKQKDISTSNCTSFIYQICHL